MNIAEEISIRILRFDDKSNSMLQMLSDFFISGLNVSIFPFTLFTENIFLSIFSAIRFTALIIMLPE